TPTDMVTANATPTDANNNPVTLTYVWKVDGKTVQTDTHNNITTPATTPDTDKLDLSKIASVKAGSKVTVTVTPSDGILTGTATTATATVNSAPVINQLQITPGNPTSSATLTANVGATDANSGDTVKFTYVWAVNGTTVQTSSTPTASTSDVLM